MTDQSADDLRRENAELKTELVKLTRRRAAEEAGLDPDCGRWLKGETLEEAKADADTLASELGEGARLTPISPEATAFQKHLEQARENAAALHPDQSNPDQNQED